MSKKGRRFSGVFKAKVALAAVRRDKTTAELAAEFGVHGNQVSAWKKQLLDGARGVVCRQAGPRGERCGRGGTRSADRASEDRGRVAENNLPSLAEEKRGWVDPEHPGLSVAHLPRSTWYYEPAGETPENLALKRRIDEL